MYYNAVPTHTIEEDEFYTIESWIDVPLTKVVITDNDTGVRGVGHSKLNVDEDKFDSTFGWNLAYLRAAARLDIKLAYRMAREGA